MSRVVFLIVILSFFPIALVHAQELEGPTTLEQVRDQIRQGNQSEDLKLHDECFTPNAELTLDIQSLNKTCELCPVHVRHDCFVTLPPAPEYPTNPTDLGEADCDAKIKLLANGRVEVVEVICTKPEFEQTSIKGFDAMRWKSEDVCGCPCKNIDRVIDYPISYRLD